MDPLEKRHRTQTDHGEAAADTCHPHKTAQPQYHQKEQQIQKLQGVTVAKFA